MDSIPAFRSPLLWALLVGFSAALGSPAIPQKQESAPAASKPATAYHVLRTYELGGEGSWDYLAVEPQSRRLFIPRSTRVAVVDADTGKPVGEIADTQGVHGVALAADLHRGFTSNGRAGTCTIFDLDKLTPIGTVKTGENPDAIVYDNTTKRVFAMNGRSHDATAIDAAEGKAIGTVALGGKPEFAVVDGKGRVFVNIEDKNEVVAFDAKDLKVIAHWPLGTGEGPSGLAIDPKNQRLFSVCSNKKMVVLNSETGAVVTTLAIGARTDGAAFDPATGCAFSSNGDGTLTVVHEDDPATFRVVENAETLPGARTCAVDPKNHVIFLPTAKQEPVADASAGGGRPRMVPGSFRIVVVGK